MVPNIVSKKDKKYSMQICSSDLFKIPPQTRSYLNTLSLSFLTCEMKVTIKI